MVFIHKIKVKPYLKKYLAFYVKTDPLVVNDNNRFGSFLLLCLKHKRHIKETDLSFKIDGPILNISVSEWHERNFGVFIPKDHQARFNKFLYDDFNDRMVDYVAARFNHKKGDIRKALLSFREKYSIYEDDLSFTTMKKQYERTIAYAISCKSA